MRMKRIQIAGRGAIAVSTAMLRWGQGMISSRLSAVFRTNGTWSRHILLNLLRECYISILSSFALTLPSQVSCERVLAFFSSKRGAATAFPSPSPQPTLQVLSGTARIVNQKGKGFHSAATPSLLKELSARDAGRRVEGGGWTVNQCPPVPNTHTTPQTQTKKTYKLSNRNPQWVLLCEILLDDRQSLRTYTRFLQLRKPWNYSMSPHFLDLFYK